MFGRVDVHCRLEGACGMFADEDEDATCWQSARSMSSIPGYSVSNAAISSASIRHAATTTKLKREQNCTGSTVRYGRYVHAFERHAAHASACTSPTPICSYRVSGWWQAKIFDFRLSMRLTCSLILQESCTTWCLAGLEIETFILHLILLPHLDSATVLYSSGAGRLPNPK